MEHIKVIEQNAISMLQMIPKREKETFEQVSEFLKEVFMSQNTALSDILLNRLTRFVVNEIRSAGITRQNADSILLMTFRQLGMEDIIDEYKNVIS